MREIYFAVLLAWLGEDGVSAQQHVVLTALREHLVRKSTTDVEGARDLIVRLPRYAERLLGTEEKR